MAVVRVRGRHDIQSSVETLRLLWSIWGVWGRFDPEQGNDSGGLEPRSLICDFLPGESCWFGTDNPPLEIIDGLDASEGGAETSDALGELGMGAS